VVPSPPLFVPGPINNRLWHIPFNRVNDVLTEQLVRGREDIFFGYEFAIQGGKLPDDVVNYYFRMFSDPDALRGSFGFYRAWDTTLAQNEQRKTRPLTMPVLAIGGAESWGEEVGNAMKLAANDVQTVVIPGAGHWVAEQAPEEILAALTAFLAPYRDGGESTERSTRTQVETYMARVEVRSFRINVPQEELVDSADGFSRRAGPKGRLSQMSRRACSSRRFRNSVGRQITIGASARRN
jgi:hypothetical protein